MKTLLCLVLSLCAAFTLAGCRKTGKEVPAAAVPGAATTVPATIPATQGKNPVMSHGDFLSAELESPVVIETYVQAAQEWWDDTITVYAQSEDGGYFLWNMACGAEEAKLLVPGTRIRVTGEKVRWAGSDQIEHGSFTLLEGSYIAPPLDVTALLGSGELSAHQNEKVSFTGLTVEPANGEGDAFLYRWDGSGTAGDDSDLYFRASRDGISFLFVVPYYLSGPTTAAYQAVITMEVGDTVDLEGFLYWYDGPQPHITSVTVYGS